MKRPRKIPLLSRTLLRRNHDSLFAPDAPPLEDDPLDNYNLENAIAAGNVSPQQKQDFMAILRQHKDEIAAMLGEQSSRNDWLSYSS